MKHSMEHRSACVATLASALVCAVCFAQAQPPAPTETKSYRVPYIMADSNHPIIRVKINGEGPFNLIYDTGAPAVFINTNVADFVKPKRTPGGQWAILDTFEVEGGPTMTKMDARIETTRVVGVLLNQRRASGLRIDGVAGYAVVARYRIEFDTTRPYMIWTPLNFNPPIVKNTNPRPQVATVDPPAVPTVYKLPRPNSVFGDLRNYPPPPLPGYVGIELDTTASSAKIAVVVPGSPAEAAGLKAGDTIIEVAGRTVRGPADLRAASPNVVAGRTVQVKVRRGQQIETVSLTPATGF